YSGVQASCMHGPPARLPADRIVPRVRGLVPTDLIVPRLPAPEPTGPIVPGHRARQPIEGITPRRVRGRPYPDRHPPAGLPGPGVRVVAAPLQQQVRNDQPQGVRHAPVGLPGLPAPHAPVALRIAEAGGTGDVAERGAMFSFSAISIAGALPAPDRLP